MELLSASLFFPVLVAALALSLLAAAPGASDRALDRSDPEPKPRVAPLRWQDGVPIVRVVVPVLDSVNALPAVRHLARELMRGERMEVHLVQVRTPLPLYVARWIPGRERAAFHRDAAERALAPARHLLERWHIRHAVHLELGDRAAVIVAAARRLGADRIVLGAARDNTLTRFVEDAVIEKVIRTAPIPVDVVAGRAVSRVERLGVPMGLSAALGLLWLRLGD
ncbi:MAG: universal stress protein [Bacteroidota bacterium]|jgi:nucleotide-binding universal stress UspA family protein